MAKAFSIKWRYRDGVAIGPAEDFSLALVIDGETTAVLKPKSRYLSDALLLLAQGADDSELLSAVGENGHDAPLLFHYLTQLRRSGLLVAELRSGDRLMATLLPRSRQFDPAVRTGQGGPWQLSRFAYLRRDGERLMLECPEAPCAVVVSSPDLMVWIQEAVEPAAAEPGTLKAELMSLLADLAFLVDPDEEESPAQRTWEFHDRLFHRHVRKFEDFRPHGGSYRFGDQFPSPPAVRPAYAGEIIPLPTQFGQTGGTLGDVMEARRSRREMAARPVALEKVAALLYRIARVRETKTWPSQEIMSRPYPSGGAIHELEFYLAVGACDGLTPGFYHYRGTEHALTRLADGDEPAREMLDGCAHSWAQPGKPPHCLVVLASRLPRLAWKYEAIAYKTSLMNAGVVIQSLYLVCTDLGLNGCAVGSGRPDLFSAATGNSSWDETSIAEFGFGNPP